VLYIRLLVVEMIARGRAKEGECTAVCSCYFTAAQKALKKAERYWIGSIVTDSPEMEAWYDIQAMMNASMAFRSAENWGCPGEKKRARKLFDLAHENYSEYVKREPSKIAPEWEGLVRRARERMNEEGR
jgi:hypothetical protein